MAAENEATAAMKGEHDGGSSAVGLRASDSAILSHYPTPLLRLLVLLGPTISAAVQFVRLATWTAGPGTASHSFIIVLAWWAVCLYGYEVVRYCPQLTLLAVLSATGIVRAFRRSQQGGNGGDRSPSTTARPASAETVNGTIDNLAVLADFGSTLYATFVVPLFRLLSWHDVEQTLGLAVFLISSWPAWLLLFSGSLAQVWDLLHLRATTAMLYANVVQPVVLLEPHVRARLAPLLAAAYDKVPASVRPHLVHAHLALNRIWLFVRQHLRPRLYALASFLSANAPDALTSAAGPRIGFFPILALRVRHLLLVIGTVALTWCSPWCALIRHSLWQSAFVRRAVRFSWSCLSGQIFFGGYNHAPSTYHEHGRLTVGPNGEPIALGTQIEDAMIFAGGATKPGKGSITRHEDVVYQFTILENQRWWMGLDWTAALLPQERPSWADEGNNPVSPPSSFSLPAPKVTLKKDARSSSSSPKYTKRMVRWQWIDPEWTVAGRDAMTGAATTASNAGPLFGAGHRRASTTSAVSAMSDAASAADGARGGGGGANELLADPSWLDVDTEGWQYGDNGWDKMSKKAGLGRYTRRRRWIRRAVLVELVQTDYVPTPDELSVGQTEAENTGSGDDDDDVKLEAGSPGSSAVKTGAARGAEGNSLRERLAKAASNGGGSAASPPQSPGAEDDAGSD